MKYINHMTSSMEDDKHEAVMELVGGGSYGLAVYGLYWGIAEKIGAQIRPEQIVTWMTKSWRKWAKIFDLKPSQFRKWVLLLADLKLIQVYIGGEMVCINMPNLLKYCDEYTKKILAKSGVSPETVPTFSGLQAFRPYQQYKDPKPEPVETVEFSAITDGTNAGGGPLGKDPPAVPSRRKSKGPEPPAGKTPIKELRASGLLAGKQPQG